MHSNSKSTPGKKQPTKKQAPKQASQTPAKQSSQPPSARKQLAQQTPLQTLSQQDSQSTASVLDRNDAEMAALLLKGKALVKVAAFNRSFRDRRAGGGARGADCPGGRRRGEAEAGRVA